MDSLGKWVAGGLFIGGICAGVIISACTAVVTGVVTVQKAGKTTSANEEQA